VYDSKEEWPGGQKLSEMSGRRNVKKGEKEKCETCRKKRGGGAKSANEGGDAVRYEKTKKKGERGRETKGRVHSEEENSGRE